MFTTEEVILKDLLKNNDCCMKCMMDWRFIVCGWLKMHGGCIRHNAHEEYAKQLMFFADECDNDE